MGIRPLHEEQGEENAHSHQIFMEPPGKQSASLASETSSVIFSSALCYLCDLGQLTAPISNSLTLQSCYEDNAWESIF